MGYFESGIVELKHMHLYEHSYTYVPVFIDKCYADNHRSYEPPMVSSNI